MGSQSEQTEQKKKLMLQALELTEGNVSKAVKKANVGRTQHYEWLKEDKVYKLAVDDIEEAQVDMSEELLRRRGKGYQYKETKVIRDKNGKIVRKEETTKTMAPSVDALKVHLAAKGRGRGYGNKIEVGGLKDAPPIEIATVKIITRNESGDSRDDSSEETA